MTDEYTAFMADQVELSRLRKQFDEVMAKWKETILRVQGLERERDAALKRVEELTGENKRLKETVAACIPGIEVLVTDDEENPIPHISPTLRKLLRGARTAVRQWANHHALSGSVKPHE